MCQKGSHTADGFAVLVHTQVFSRKIHRVGMPFEQRTEKMLSSQLKNSAISVNGGSNMT